MKFVPSLSQQAVWLSCQLNPDAPHFNLMWQIDIEGPLNVERLRDGVRTIVDRHEALRTRFVEEGGALFQVVENSLVLEWSLFALDATTDNDHSIQMQEIGRAFSTQPFDLERGPLLRIGLIKRSSTHHRFLFAVHHLVFDGGSWPVLVNELLSLYGGEMLAPVEMQHRSYVEWQDQLTETSKWADAARHWSDVAAAEPASFDMILDRSRRPSMSLEAGVYSHLLPETLVNALRDVSKHAGSTLFKTLFAAFCVLLHKLSDTRDVVVRSTLTGRAREEVEQGIGYYVNTTVVRAQVSRSASFLEIVRQITRKFDDAVENEAFLFEGVCKRIEGLAHLVDGSVANVSLTKMPAPLERKVGGTTFSDARTFLEAGPSDLAVYSQEVDRRIRLTSVFRRGVLEEHTIAWLMRCFQTLLENSVREVGLQVADLKLLRDEDRGELDLARNLIGPGTPFEIFPAEAIERPIGDRFQLQVDRASQNLAVVTRQHAWRYDELSTKANGVCAALAPYLAGSSKNVALLFEHGAPMIAALLGVLKSGAAYVPLETSMPAERLKGIVNDCEARVLVTDGGMVELARQLMPLDGYLVNVDELANGETLVREPVIHPDALAYILYTSGSTGVPKGVVQNHRNVLYHAKTYANALHLNPQDRISLFSGYGFDASVMDIFGALLNGATLYPCDVRNESVADIVRWLVEQRITVLHCTPTLFRHLCSYMDPQSDLSSIRIVVLGGEPALASDHQLFRRHFHLDALLVNGLGPTESTLTLQYFMDHSTVINTDKLKVGYPVAGTEILLLDDEGAETEVYGEIAIKSPHVAVEYWRRPDLTSAAFPVDVKGSGSRIYRTGDRGHRYADGSFGFCGRRDHQVKVRGFRIELGEIEAALAQHADILECAVVARMDGKGDQTIVAYVVPRTPNPTSHDLRQFLRNRIPHFMVPSAFVRLESFTLTESGKVNRRLLPPVNDDDMNAERKFVTPRTATEARLAAIWREMLATDSVGADDDFFDLGGHSLAASRVVSRIRLVFGNEISLRQFFEHPTLEALAALVDNRVAP